MELSKDMAAKGAYREYDLKTQREIQEIHTTLKDMKQDMGDGFSAINKRLDVINGCSREHGERIRVMETNIANQGFNANSWVESHLKNHKEFEDGISKKVSFYSIVASVIGAMLAASMGVVAWFTGLFERR